MDQDKQVPRRKLISKAHKKTKKRMERLAESYENTKKDGSALKKFMQEDQPEMDFDMTNQITMGQGRKMRKKLKKLKKQISGDHAEDQIFK